MVARRVVDHATYSLESKRPGATGRSPCRDEVMSRRRRRTASSAGEVVTPAAAVDNCLTDRALTGCALAMRLVTHWPEAIARRCPIFSRKNIAKYPVGQKRPSKRPRLLSK